ncbi:MAG TPA: hypothetical protein VN666_00230 [Nitrospira sp.]|nr:hypothetical protein [Nitrospira sp.]
MMLFRTTHFELEIAKFLYVRAPWLGVIYVGPDSGRGCIVRYSPQQLEFDHLEYIEMTRRNLRTR